MIPSFLQVAAAANALADECAGPNPPKLGQHDLFPIDGGDPCAAGQVFGSVGIRPSDEIATIIWASDKGAAYRAVLSSNDTALPEDRPRAVVEPLRAWAKALSEAA